MLIAGYTLSVSDSRSSMFGTCVRGQRIWCQILNGVSFFFWRGGESRAAVIVAILLLLLEVVIVVVVVVLV